MMNPVEPKIQPTFLSLEKGSNQKKSLTPYEAVIRLLRGDSGTR